MLTNLEKIRMYYILKKIMLESEQYDKARSVMSAKEFQDLLRNRFYVMRDVLVPVKDVLSKNIEVTNLYFAKGFDDSSSIVVEYKENGIFKFFTISQYDKDDIEVSFSLYNVDLQNILMQEKRKINLAFEECYHRNYDYEVQIPSTSKNFSLTGYNNEFSISDKTGNLFNILFQFNSHDKDDKIINPDSVKCLNQAIKDFFVNSDNLQKFLENVKIYEENVPKYLKKIL